MNTSTIAYPSSLQTAPAAARQTLKLLERLTHGQLTVQLPDGSQRLFGPSHDSGAGSQADAGPHAKVILNNWNVCTATLKSGDIGLAESYIAGDWTTPNLTELLRLFIRNREQLEDVIYGSWAGRSVAALAADRPPADQP